jgi:AcrR family transcriptional regulator
MGRPRVRNKILLAASELLKEQGITGLTTRGVAKHAGVTEASVFNNFQDKAGLIQALLREQMSEYTRFSEALAEAVEPDLPTWLARVFRAARSFFRVVLPLAAPQLSRGPQPGSAQSPENYMGHSALTEKFQELQEHGVISPTADVAAGALLLMGAAMHSALTAETLGGDVLGGDEKLVTGVSESLAALLSIGL